ncbi:MAG: (2E,6E)-farnesyl diphosphate synthase [Thiotrichaceae bacterium]
MSLQNLMQVTQQRTEIALDKWLPPATVPPTRLHEAMRYSVLHGGKRIRPLLVYLAGKALNVREEWLDAPACAIEFIHAYSLIHDDLPAMDDDVLRRGRATCHIAYDEATAILAGDALQTLAFYVLSHYDAPIAATRRLQLIEILALASGSRGMVGGQAIDIDSVGKSLNIAELENMHIHKTGALIRASVRLGALSCPEITDNQLQQLDAYAKCIGLAFQIQDDILDVEASTDILGKTSGADQAHDKPTYPNIIGLQESKQLAQRLIDQAIINLDNLAEAAEPLRELARYIITRNF